jgi:hypothetical protein
MFVAFQEFSYPSFLLHLASCIRPAFSVLLLAFIMFSSPDASASVDGRISGTVTDQSGAAIFKVNVTVTDTQTGIQQTVATDDRGFYSFPSLPVGHYVLEISSASFRPYRRTAIVLDANSALTIDVVLLVGSRADAVEVVENQVAVETSTTQNGEVITAAEMTAVPLNGRSFTDLLTLQPGVAPLTSINSNTVQAVGASVLEPSGDLNPGTVSINGQREFANSFIVNGSDVEDVNNGASIIPNLDSIAEFRILTNSFDAEYGEFSGGQINVVTKSGTNAFRGDLFEFARNTALDARNFFSPTRGTFDRNQFGGTFGGPIRKNKIFLFSDYQGTRSTQGVDTGQIPVPSAQDRTGNLSDLASSFVTTGANGTTVPTTVSGPSFANMLSQKLGYTVTADEDYFTPGCTLATCVFPNAVIPQRAWSDPAKNLLQYIPSPNAANNTFSASTYNQTLRDDKGAYRIDANTR